MTEAQYPGLRWEAVGKWLRDVPVLLFRARPGCCDVEEAGRRVRFVVFRPV